MTAFLFYYLFLALSVCAAVALLVIWIRDVLRQRQARQRRRLAFYTSPFLAHWPEEKPRENFRKVWR